jgi:hypothetical protein
MKGDTMKAIRPDSLNRCSLASRSTLSIASMTVLLLLAGFSLMTTGCSDDDDDDACCAGGGTDAGGLGGQTYTVPTFVGQTGSQLVLVTRGGGTSAAASTSGVLGTNLAAGPVDGVLVFDNGLRSILTGNYDPEVTGGSNLTAGNSEGVSYEGNATATEFFGTLKVEAIDTIPGLFGNGGQEDAPLIHLLGLWEQNTQLVANCGSLGQFTLGCTGVTRIRKLGLSLRMDLYETCEDAAPECTLTGPQLNDGTWSGLNYSDSVDVTRNLSGCSIEITGDMGLSVDAQTLSSSTTGTVRFTNSNCLPANTECPLEQTMTGTRCIDCWPADCTDGF